MSCDLRDGQIIFTCGTFFDMAAKVGTLHTVGLPLDGYSLHSTTSEYGSNRQLGLKDLKGDLIYGNMSVPFDDLYELNDFLNYVDEVVEKRNGEVSVEKILAAIEMEGQKSIAAARHVVDHIDDFNFFVGVSSYEELGRRLLQERIPQDVFADIEPALDAELYGEFYADNCEYNCCLTETGFIERTANYLPFEMEGGELEQTM
ncbi:MAG: hypothetical protein VB092_07395 [Oscillospiraceae bacterium]|nr:hypothetical protein [Oscillospiraceae bacterium]